MILQNDYFRIDSCAEADGESLLRVTLLPDFCAYEGHFPGNPVSPGVCNIQMIRECAEILTGKRLFLGYIAQCRMSAVITPLTTPQLLIRIRISETDGVYGVHATISDEKHSVHRNDGSENTKYLEFKGELTPAGTTDGEI